MEATMKQSKRLQWQRCKAKGLVILVAAQLRRLGEVHI